MSDRPQKFDIAVAYKAIALADMSGAAKQVGAAIIDHFNRKTGRCDPSVDRLATLLDINGATVRRATSELVEAGMLTKDSHGGRFNTASYSPCWDRFREVVLDWNDRMRTGKGAEGATSKRAKMRGSTAQKCAVDARKNALQTYSNNQPDEPYPVVPPSITVANRVPDEAPNGRKGLGRKEPGIHRQGYLVHALQGGRSVSHADAAEAAQQRRTAKAIQNLPRAEDREAAWLRALGEPGR